MTKSRQNLSWTFFVASSAFVDIYYYVRSAVVASTSALGTGLRCEWASRRHRKTPCILVEQLQTQQNLPFWCGFWVYIRRRRLGLQPPSVPCCRRSLDGHRAHAAYIYSNVIINARPAVGGVRTSGGGGGRRAGEGRRAEAPPSELAATLLHGEAQILISWRQAAATDTRIDDA